MSLLTIQAACPWLRLAVDLPSGLKSLAID